MTMLFALASVAAAVPATQDGAGLCTSATQAIDASAAKTLAQGSPGMVVVVARRERVLFTGTYGFSDLEHRVQIQAGTVFALASLTKQFTAAVVLSLVEDGQIALDDSVTKFVPELTAARDVRIRDLLIQTSGIPDYAEDPSIDHVKARAVTSAEKLAWIVRLTPKLTFVPGTRWQYSNSNYALLGLIAERTSGQSLGGLLAKRVTERLPSETLAFDDPRDVVPGRARGYRRSKQAPAGFVNADWISPTVPGPAGGLRGTALDLVKWEAALFGGRIVSRPMLAAMTAPGIMRDGRTTKLGMPIEWQQGMNSDYGMGVFIKPTSGGLRIGHQGDVDGFSTWSAHYPASGITIVQMINSESADLGVDAVENAVFSGQGNTPCTGPFATGNGQDR